MQTPLPIEEYRISTSQATKQQIFGYQQRIGSLNFAAVISRPDRRIDIHQCWLREQLKEGAISIKWTPSAEVLADGFTKALTVQGHKNFTEVIGLVDISQVQVRNS